MFDHVTLRVPDLTVTSRGLAAVPRGDRCDGGVLALDDRAYITRETIVVDGGHKLHVRSGQSV
jgi:hypothetical protein